MPESLAVACIQCEKVSVCIAGEGKSGIGGQHSGTRASWAKFVGPANLSGLVINRFQYTFAPEPVIRACPTIRAIRRFVEVNAVGGVSIHDKQARLGVKAGRAVVGQAALVRRNQAAVRR